MKKLNILQKFILIFCSVFFFVGCNHNIGEINNIDEGLSLKIEKFNEIGGIDYSNTKKITLLDYTKTAKSSNNTLAQAVGNALVADGLSAGVGMIAVAVAGILGGPLGWTALAITFGESVISSGIAAFFNYRRNRNSPEIIVSP